MRPFGSKAPKAFLPPGTAARIVAFGHAEFAGTGTVDDYRLQPDMYQLQQADPERFIREMETLAADGGWLAYGVSRLVGSVAGPDLRHPAFDSIMESALRFLRSEGVPAMRLNGYELSYWSRHHPGEPWV